ncbi:MAG: efflux transporter outer membrane subunit [Desulfobacterales bacterium]|jgi:NodT family efflux transporter outer membrane factor (OMF) lipoprotein|nr:efflux transporter outer membrane subunit [Desulfobacterales bacterium]
MFHMGYASSIDFKISRKESFREFPKASRLRHLAKRLLVLTACFGVVMIYSCAVGPDFHRPQVSVPAGWAGPTAKPAEHPKTPGGRELADWWTLFQDPILTSLINRAVSSNLDLKLAEARIREARAAKGVAAGGLGPTLDASGSYQRSRFSAASGTGSSSVDQYQAGFDAGWEIDIFGGQRRNLEAADADLQAAVETRRDVLVSLTAEVARNYINLRAFQQQIVITQKNLEAQRHSAKLTRQRFEGGFVSGLDVANAEAQSATTAAQIPLLESSVQQAIYSLSVLLGEPPVSLAAELSPTGTIPSAPPEVPAGVPSELMRRRPDIRRVEAQIHAATARVGVAAAELFPKFTIAGSAGYQSGKFSSWFDWAYRFWSFGPSLSWRLFESGRIRAGVELQKALQEQEVITYRQTVLSALQEVENALIASAKEQAHREALVTAVVANRKAVALAETLYTEGQTDFLNVLQAQGALYATEDALVQSTSTVSTNLVALYKALGGGWRNDPTVKATALAE